MPELSRTQTSVMADGGTAQVSSACTVGTWRVVAAGLPPVARGRLHGDHEVLDQGLAALVQHHVGARCRREQGDRGHGARRTGEGDDPTGRCRRCRRHDQDDGRGDAGPRLRPSPAHPPVGGCGGARRRPRLESAEHGLLEFCGYLVGPCVVDRSSDATAARRRAEPVQPPRPDSRRSRRGGPGGPRPLRARACRATHGELALPPDAPLVRHSVPPDLVERQAERLEHVEADGCGPCPRGSRAGWLLRRLAGRGSRSPPRRSDARVGGAGAPPRRATRASPCPVRSPRAAARRAAGRPSARPASRARSMMMRRSMAKSQVRMPPNDGVEPVPCPPGAHERLLDRLLGEAGVAEATDGRSRTARRRGR